MHTDSLISVKKKLFARCALALLVQDSASLSTPCDPFFASTVQKHSCTPYPSVCSSSSKEKSSFILRPFSHLFVNKKGKACGTSILASPSPAGFFHAILSGKEKKDGCTPQRFPCPTSCHHSSRIPLSSSTSSIPSEKKIPSKVSQEILSLCEESAIIPLSVFMACCMHHKNTPPEFHMDRAESLTFLQALVHAGSIVCYRRQGGTVPLTLSSPPCEAPFSWPSWIGSAFSREDMTTRVGTPTHRPSVERRTTPDLEAAHRSFMEERARSNEAKTAGNTFQKRVDEKKETEGTNQQKNGRLHHVASLDGVVPKKTPKEYRIPDVMEEETHIFLFLKPERFVFRIHENILDRVASMDPPGRKGVVALSSPPREQMSHDGVSSRDRNTLGTERIPESRKHPPFPGEEACLDTPPPPPGSIPFRLPTLPFSSPPLSCRVDQERHTATRMTPDFPSPHPRAMPSTTTPAHVRTAKGSKSIPIPRFSWIEVPSLHSFRLYGGGGAAWKEKPTEEATDGQGSGGTSCGGDPPRASSPIPFDLLRCPSSFRFRIPSEADLSHALLSLRARRQRDWAFRSLVFSCLLLLLGYGTFIAYGWDVMEPICYFGMSALSLLGMAAAILRTRRTPSLAFLSPATRSFVSCRTPAWRSSRSSVGDVSRMSATEEEEMALQHMQQQFSDEKMLLELSFEESIDVWKSMNEPAGKQQEKHSIALRWTRWFSCPWRGEQRQVNKEKDEVVYRAHPFASTTPNGDRTRLPGALCGPSSVSSALAWNHRVLLHFCREKAVIASTLDAPPATSAAYRYSVCSHRRASFRKDGESVVQW